MKALRGKLLYESAFPGVILKFELRELVEGIDIVEVIELIVGNILLIEDGYEPFIGHFSIKINDNSYVISLRKCPLCHACSIPERGGPANLRSTLSSDASS